MRSLRISGAVGFAAFLSLAGCDGSIGAPAGRHGGTNTVSTGAFETPGRTPLRRLTNAQYNETVHALLGVEGDFAQNFGPDEEVGGFPPNVSVPASATLVEQ